MHDPGDECDCSECRVKALWPAEQVTREARPTQDRVNEQMREAISGLSMRIDRLEDSLSHLASFVRANP